MYRGRKHLANRAEIEDRICCDSLVPRVISETVIKETSLTIYADCDRNVASFPVARQNRSNILRDNRFNVPLAAHWHGSKQSADQDRKNSRPIHRAILYCSPDVGNAIARSRRKTVLLESLRSPPTEGYPKVSVTFSIALLIIWA